MGKIEEEKVENIPDESLIIAIDGKYWLPGKLSVVREGEQFIEGLGEGYIIFKILPLYSF